MITKITCRYSFEVLDFHSNDFGFTFNIGVSYLGIYKTSMLAIALAALRAITLKLSLVPFFKLCACVNFPEFYQFAKVYARESLCSYLNSEMCIKYPLNCFAINMHGYYKLLLLLLFNTL